MTLNLLRLWRKRLHWTLKARGRQRPQLEVLEDRLTPAPLLVTTRADVVNEGDGKLSLREAISRANATEERDTIVLPAGVYEIARAGPGDDDNASGDFDI